MNDKKLIEPKDEVLDLTTASGVIRTLENLVGSAEDEKRKVRDGGYPEGKEADYEAYYHGRCDAFRIALILFKQIHPEAEAMTELGRDIEYFDHSLNNSYTRVVRVEPNDYCLLKNDFRKAIYGNRGRPKAK